MSGLPHRFRRWCSWQRVASAVPLLAIVAGIGFAVASLVRAGRGGADLLVPLAFGALVAAGLGWVLRRREDLVTPEARWIDFIGRHTPAPDDLVCLFQDDFGLDLASVVIDRAAGRIVFERCHAPRRWPLSWNEARYSCRVSDIEGFIPPLKAPDAKPEHAHPLVVITPRGRATIPASADGLAGVVAFLESRVEPVRRTAADRPESMNAVVGGALAGMAAGPAIGLSLWPGLSEAAFAWWFLGGTVAGAFLTHVVLDLVDRTFGVDLASPVGGAVKGMTIALQGAVPLSFVAASAGMDWAWVWLTPVAAAVGAILGAVCGRRPADGSPPRIATNLAVLRSRLKSLEEDAIGPVASESLRESLAAQWERRLADPRAYVGDLLHALVRESRAAGRGGAWRPEVEVSDGEVLVRCGWTHVGQHGSTRPGDPDGPTATRALLRAILHFAMVLRESPQAPYRLVVEFPRPEGVAALVRPTHPDPETCRRLGFDGEGRLVVGIREIAPSPASLPLPPLADVLRPEPRAEPGAEEPDEPPSRERIAE